MLLQEDLSLKKAKKLPSTPTPKCVLLSHLGQDYLSKYSLLHGGNVDLRKDSLDVNGLVKLVQQISSAEKDGSILLAIAFRLLHFRSWSESLNEQLQEVFLLLTKDHKIPGDIKWVSAQDFFLYFSDFCYREMSKLHSRFWRNRKSSHQGRLTSRSQRRMQLHHLHWPPLLLP